MGALESSDCGLSLDPQAFGQAVASDCRAPFSFLGITQAWRLFQLPPPPLGLDLQQGVLTTGYHTGYGLPTFSWAFFLDSLSIQLSSSRVFTNTDLTLSISSLTWGSVYPYVLEGVTSIPGLA